MCTGMGMGGKKAPPLELGSWPVDGVAWAGKSVAMCDASAGGLVGAAGRAGMGDGCSIGGVDVECASEEED